MMNREKNLLALTAADLMTRSVVTIEQDMPIQSAARLLSRHNVTGAPVVDKDGKCVGILSATDIVHWAGKEQSDKHACPSESLEFVQAWQMIEPEDLPHDVVANYMTPQVVAVPPNKTIAELARTMIDAHIHRLIVVDGNGRLEGIVTATDILAALAYAHEHQPTANR